MAVQLTHNQVLHRAYLQSPVWKNKRSEALAFYGCICNRCKEHGTDVHHKTYERWGGNELMEDLEVLCRECHKAHHALDRATQKPKSYRRTLHRRALLDKLTAKHCQILWNKYPNIKNLKDLFIALNNSGPNEVAEDAAYLLGVSLLSDKEAAGFEQFGSDHRRKMRIIHRKMLTKP